MSATNFGIIIACHARDAHYAAGCYASIRHFMPGTPICFLYDGDDPPKKLANLPNTSFITRRSCQNEALRKRSFRPGFTKMVAFFESPFETFLYLDADTTVCGDVSHLADFEKFDIVVDKRYNYTDEDIQRWYFSPARIAAAFPEFDWSKHRTDYFCTGTFFSKRNALSLERYFELLDVHESNPGLFQFWEMGLLNFMIFEAADKGQSCVNGIPYQIITCDHSAAALQQDFNRWLNDIKNGEPPVVYHYPLNKPHMRQHRSYSAPMTHFRKHFFIMQTGRLGWNNNAALNLEDIRFHYVPEMKRKAFINLIYEPYKKVGLRRVIKKIKSK